MSNANNVKQAIKKANQDIETKITYYQTLGYIKRKGEYGRIEKFIQNMITNTSDATINDFELKLFDRIKEVYNDIKPYNSTGTLYVPPKYIVEDAPAGDY